MRPIHGALLPLSNTNRLFSKRCCARPTAVAVSAPLRQPCLYVRPLLDPAAAPPGLAYARQQRRLRAHRGEGNLKRMGSRLGSSTVRKPAQKAGLTS